jgi:mannose-6-phosphate isomerase-like protein (cupin superfamily)
MVKAVDIRAALQPLQVWHGRKPRGGDAEPGGNYFATLAAYRDGAIFAGSFDGDSEWERHANGDEVVHVLAGETELTVITAEGPQVLRLAEGMLTVVPRGCWHRFHAPKGVTVLTVTPQPTEHSTAEDPRQAG